MTYAVTFASRAGSQGLLVVFVPADWLRLILNLDPIALRPSSSLAGGLCVPLPRLTEAALNGAMPGAASVATTTDATDAVDGGLSVSRDSDKAAALALRRAVRSA